MKKLKLFSKYDLPVLMAISLLCILLLIPQFLVKDENLIATVTKDSEVIKTINLNEVEQGYYIDIDSAPEVRIRVEKGRIRFCEADCPDKLCVRYGWLESSADSAVCLPAKVVISISGQKDGSPDVITY